MTASRWSCPICGGKLWHFYDTDRDVCDGPEKHTFQWHWTDGLSLRRTSEAPPDYNKMHVMGDFLAILASGSIVKLAIDPPHFELPKKAGPRLSLWQRVKYWLAYEGDATNRRT